MRVLLELVRIILIFGILGGILSQLLKNVYLAFGMDAYNYGWIGYIAILIFLFVLYRNKWQFSGWYKGKGREKLPKKVSQVLTFVVIILLLSPPVISIVMS
ncbi:hypothetical protein SAMN04487944_11613 [Gracilibacillus ureilyticus]|uniref:Uncharacterized protein n=1 Tax=Gracilibacillus ureilyticus TaxID=531814 RepID=A0A1H9U5F7_9BACI|nr:hypothetical protein [Gracilibacillus ureilyticus]SES04468.1 hypothetical protein SAMN04487944_11613 [Gracilibacillus ureilyticus]